MADAPTCLHCQIMSLVATRAGIDSDNEIAFKVLEVLAEIIAASPTRIMRRAFIADCEKSLPRMVTGKRSERDAAGLAPSRVVTRH